MFSLQEKNSGELRENMTLREFLSLTSGSEQAFLSLSELDRFIPTCCGMTNGAGGWIILGAGLGEDDLPVAEGIQNVVSLEKQLALLWQDSPMKNVNHVPYFRVISEAGKKILVVRVESAEWRVRPICVGKEARVYRRIEGENVISGRKIRCRMALDALETSLDDTSVPGMTLSDLDDESVSSFRDKLVAVFPKWKALSVENFLKHALVLDECGEVTRAGELLLGKNPNRACLTFRDAQKTQHIPNLWLACEVLLPQISSGLSATCAEALRECFVNAVLHAEHDAGIVDVEFRDDMAIFSNPGLPRCLEQGKSKSEVRNYRLMRIFVMAGLARNAGQGLKIIRKYDANFRPRWDMMKLATVSELPLPTEMKFYIPKEASSSNFGWLPVVQEKHAMLLDSPEKSLEEENINTDSIEFAPSEKDLPEPEFDDGYLGTSDDEDDVFSPLVKKIRETPRVSSAVIRDAILELCAEYKSLSDLASALARSEDSLRRRYVTPMIKEGLLEMEPPVRADHPDQRYRVRKTD